jgi:hypothetical protein
VLRTGKGLRTQTTEFRKETTAMSTTNSFIWEAAEDELRWHDLASFLDFCKRNLKDDFLAVAETEARDAEIGFLDRRERNGKLLASEQRELDQVL